MKKALSLLAVIALLICVLPTAIAAENSVVLVDVADQAVTADAPYVYEGVASEDGILTVAPTGSPDWGFKVSVGDAEGIMQSGSFANYEFEVLAGQAYKVEVYAYTNWSTVAGTVGLKLTFTPSTGSVVQKQEYVFDDVYKAGNAMTVGTYQLTLKENAEHTLYYFEPEEIGVYTFTVSDGAIIGYWGSGSHYVSNPQSTASSVEREVKQVGQGVMVGISSEDPNVTLTIAKTGESAGIVETVFVDWETVHTPSTSYVGTPAGVTLTEIDITQAYTVVLGEDGFYHLDSADGPVIYVDLKNGEFDLGQAFGSYGALTMRGQFNGVNYDFKATMEAYNTAITGTDGVYPVTEDLYAFLVGYGNGAGLWYDQNLSSFAEIQAGDFNPDSAWMVMCLYGTADVVVPEEPAQQTLELTVGDNSAEMLPDTKYILSLDLGDVQENAGTLTWSDGVSVTANGVAIACPYNLANYNAHVELVATVVAQTQATFTITLPEAPDGSALVLGDNAVEVEDTENGAIVTFTAEHTGVYILSAAADESNHDIFLVTDSGTEQIDISEGYEFALNAGESISFAVLTLDWEVDTIDLVLQRQAPAEVSLSIPEGEHQQTLDPNTNYNLTLILGDTLQNAGTFTWSEGVTVTADGVTISSPYDLANYNRRVLLVATVEELTEATFTVTLPEEIPAIELVLGDNAVEVTDGWNGNKAQFTAAEAGTYVLSAAEGESNAVVILMIQTGTETIDLPYTVELTAGETVEFSVTTVNGDLDTVNLVLVKACDHKDAEYISAVPFTHTENGTAGYYYCKVCDGKYDAVGVDATELTDEELVMQASGHIRAEKVLAVEPTCTTDGNVEYYHCAECNANFQGRAPEAALLENVVIPATGHSYADGVCSACGEKDPTYVAPDAKNGLQKGDDGEYYYYINGEVQTQYTGFIENTAGQWYIENGHCNLARDGMVTVDGTKYLLKSGHVNTAFTGITKQEGVYYYFTEGVNDLEHEGLVYCNGMKAYVQNGEVNFNKSGVVDDGGNLVYVKYGIWRNTFKGLARTDDGNWLYFVNGTFDETYTGVAKLNSMWVYVAEGKVDFNFSGTFPVNGVNYTIKYGVVQF